MSFATLTTFLGWCSVLNLSLLLFSTLMIVALKGPLSRLHGHLLGIAPVDLLPIYLYYLSATTKWPLSCSTWCPIWR